MTAEEQYNKAETPEDIIEVMKEFAKYHVEQALSAASKKALIEYGMDEDENPFLGNPVWSEDYKYRGDRLPTMKIYKPSILKSYPLENIK